MFKLWWSWVGALGLRLTRGLEPAFGRPDEKKAPRGLSRAGLVIWDEGWRWSGADCDDTPPHKAVGAVIVNQELVAGCIGVSGAHRCEEAVLLRIEEDDDLAVAAGVEADVVSA